MLDCDMPNKTYRAVSALGISIVTSRIFIASIVFTVVAILLQTTDPLQRINETNFEQLTRGMTENQVLAILRSKPDRQHHPWDIAVFLKLAPGTDPDWEKMWFGAEKMVIILHFDDQGKVCNKGFLSMDWE
jgi:hypothetical protein